MSRAKFSDSVGVSLTETSNDIQTTINRISFIKGTEPNNARYLKDGNWQTIPLAVLKKTIKTKPRRPIKFYEKTKDGNLDLVTTIIGQDEVSIRTILRKICCGDRELKLGLEDYYQMKVRDTYGKHGIQLHSARKMVREKYMSIFSELFHQDVTEQDIDFDENLINMGLIPWDQDTVKLTKKDDVRGWLNPVQKRRHDMSKPIKGWIQKWKYGDSETIYRAFPGFINDSNGKKMTKARVKAIIGTRGGYYQENLNRWMLDDFSKKNWKKIMKGCKKSLGIDDIENMIKAKYGNVDAQFIGITDEDGVVMYHIRYPTAEGHDSGFIELDENTAFLIRDAGLHFTPEGMIDVIERRIPGFFRLSGLEMYNTLRDLTKSGKAETLDIELMTQLEKVEENELFTYNNPNVLSGDELIDSSLKLISVLSEGFYQYSRKANMGTIINDILRRCQKEEFEKMWDEVSMKKKKKMQKKFDEDILPTVLGEYKKWHERYLAEVEKAEEYYSELEAVEDFDTKFDLGLEVNLLEEGLYRTAQRESGGSLYLLNYMRVALYPYMILTMRKYRPNFSNYNEEELVDELERYGASVSGSLQQKRERLEKLKQFVAQHARDSIRLGMLRIRDISDCPTSIFSELALGDYTMQKRPDDKLVTVTTYMLNYLTYCVDTTVASLIAIDNTTQKKISIEIPETFNWDETFGDLKLVGDVQEKCADEIRFGETEGTVLLNYEEVDGEMQIVCYNREDVLEEIKTGNYPKGKYDKKYIKRMKKRYPWYFE